ncbi:BPSL0067 family protein [Massilia sp. TS11]|uniref:BPSL0067 family protein n=1 Tax=Massilia sp. TS11 TaxID=2908003 RepID=UPI001EDBF0D9|nr:BPSL0067 family protein [Massilia sp. TS11]MCG2583570.1 BPSL0067 family protein [Massilia sp. TS11]
MPYVYINARKLDGQPKVGDFECVALVRTYTNAPPSMVWREGEKVLGNKEIAPGTAIATFENGRYPTHPKGKHAAFHLGQVSNGIYIVDQWDNPEKKTISIRFIYDKGKKKDGSFVTPSDNAAAFSIIK